MNSDQSTYSITAQETGRGTLILGIFSILLFGPFLGIPAWIMGRKDLRKIAAGTIHPSAKEQTKAGMILGAIGTFVSLFGIILFGMIVAVAITIFADSAISANRTAVTQDLRQLASQAHLFYQTPVSDGGGGGSFELLTADSIGMAHLSSKPDNSNGSYRITKDGTKFRVDLEGVGVEVEDDEHIKLHLIVWPNADSIYVVN